VTHAASFHEVNSLHDHILRVKDSEEVPFVLVGNKVCTRRRDKGEVANYCLQCDLESHREVPKEKGMELANKLKCKFLESSAKDRINVTESFFELVQAIKNYRVIHTPKEFSTDKKESRKRLCTLL
jgi:GTPase KRas protein